MDRLVALFSFIAVLFLGACSRGGLPSSEVNEEAARATEVSQAHEASAHGSSVNRAAGWYEARTGLAKPFANLLDRGELVSYAPSAGRGGQVVEGGYTSSRVLVSEEHALSAIATGRLRTTTPSGEVLDIRYDSHVEHPDGDLTWIGHLEGAESAETILRFGASSVFGTIARPGKRSLELATKDGVTWLIDNDHDDSATVTSLAAIQNNKTSLAASPVAQAQSAGTRYPRDIEGDGTSELLVRTPTGFRYYKTWTSTWSEEIPIGASWQVVASGYFNGDQYLDLVWAAESTRALYMWIGGPDGFRRVSIGYYGLGWSIVGAGDIDGDGKTDLLWRYYKTAPDNFSWWVMDGPVRTRIGYGTLGASWRLAAVGDFSGDDKADLIWNADSIRALVQWDSTGSSFSGHVLGSYPPGWYVVGSRTGGAEYGPDGLVDHVLLRYYKSAPDNIGYWADGAIQNLGIGQGASWAVGAQGNFGGTRSPDGDGIVWVSDIDNGTAYEHDQIQYDLVHGGYKYPLSELPAGWSYINR